MTRFQNFIYLAIISLNLTSYITLINLGTVCILQPGSFRNSTILGEMLNIWIHRFRSFVNDNVILRVHQSLKLGGISWIAPFVEVSGVLMLSLINILKNL